MQSLQKTLDEATAYKFIFYFSLYKVVDAKFKVFLFHTL